MQNNKYSLIELVVKNHPGTMSHITGLFARRAFNLEGILCGRIGDGTKSKIYLLVKNDDLKEQIVKQLQKLYDVISVSLHDEYNSSVFDNLDMLLNINDN
jgi:acetolactate synthase-1/3 small subunit